ncbi:hypothetical protein [Singulisphaera sp. PoT]|uniref:hypothetical protein n=1 Tax=Singulisphaera sp. PoT TaxID=3411797 RepID=UPI003BF48249
MSDPNPSNQADPDNGQEPHITDDQTLLKEEREAIGIRREFAYSHKGKDHEIAEDLIGLSLSGGGLRSATFNLGLIQALQKNKFFKHIDYLITISGGGYIGSHLAHQAAIKSAEVEKESIRPAGATKAVEAAALRPTTHQPTSAFEASTLQVPTLQPTTYQATTHRPAEVVEATTLQATADARDQSDRESIGVDNWFPYHVGEGGKQHQRILDFFSQGNYLERSTQFVSVWIPGTILNLLTLLSLLITLSALAAFAFRVIDYPAVDLGMRYLSRNVLLFFHWLNLDYIEDGASRWSLNAKVSIILLIVLFPIILLHLKSRWERLLNQSATTALMRSVGHPRSRHFLMRFAGTIPWPYFIFWLSLCGIQLLDWPRNSEIDEGFDAINEVCIRPIADEDESVEEYRRDEEVHRLKTVIAQAQVVSSEIYVSPRLVKLNDEAGRRGEILLYLVSGDLDRYRFALPLLDKLLDEQDGKKYDYLSDESLKAEVKESIPKAIENFEKSLSDLKVQAGDQLPLEPSVHDLDLKNVLAERLILARVVEINGLIITDLLRAMLPAVLCGTCYLGLVSYRHLIQNKEIGQACGRHPGDVISKLWGLCWILTGLGFILTLTNGDTDIGFLKYLMPSVPGVQTIADPVTGAVSGARMTLSGALAFLRSIIFTVPALFTTLLAMVPIVSRAQFMRSAEQPKDPARGRLFRMVVGSVVVVLPLSAFAFLARENVSGTAPPNPASKKSPVESSMATLVPTLWGQWSGSRSEAGNTLVGGTSRQVARLAFCTGSPFLTRAYLIENDQIVRLLVLLVCGLTFAFLASVVDLNRTSIHTFYRDRLYEAYFAESPNEPRRDIPLHEQDGSRVAFPLHIIAATLNQFHATDERKKHQHNFIFSRLYCGSEPTGYCRTEHYLGGGDLADAVAISGAAISPVQAKSLMTRVVMLVLNMRLGQWYPNPDPEHRNKYPSRPKVGRILWEHRQLLLPFLMRHPQYTRDKPGSGAGPGVSPDDGGSGPHLSQGGDSRQRGSEVDASPPEHPTACDEDSTASPRASIVKELHPFCFLSDGAHYDNLGIELLLQRRCRLMIVSDVSHDPKYSCEDLVAVFRRASALKGITFTSISMSRVRETLNLTKIDPHPDPDPRLDPFHFRSEDPEALAKTLRARLANENFLVGRVDYTESSTVGPNQGILILIKPTLTLELADNTALIQYFLENSNFPHDTDLDQIYDEARVEAYRQLGECIGNAFSQLLQSPGDDPEHADDPVIARGTLLGKVESLCRLIPTPGHRSGHAKDPGPKPESHTAVEVENYVVDTINFVDVLQALGPLDEPRLDLQYSAEHMFDDTQADRACSDLAPQVESSDGDAMLGSDSPSVESDGSAAAQGEQAAVPPGDHSAIRPEESKTGVIGDESGTGG